MLKTILVSLSFSTLLACGTDPDSESGVIGGATSVRDACEDLSAATCDRMYACVSPEDLQAAGFPSTVEGCVAQLSQANCASLTSANACDDDGGTFHQDQADLCIQQVSDATCEQLLDPNDADAAPACDQICS